MTGAVWSAANVYLTRHIIKIALLQGDKKRLALMLLVKFPVLYVGGFFILISGFFPLSSILLGLPVIFLVMGTVKIWPKGK